jgi:Transglutaminase-like superfamily
MRRIRKSVLVFTALYELLSYEVVDHLVGFNGLLNAIKRARTRGHRSSVESSDVCRAVDTAACIYFKPVRCLQRSMATARLLRRHGLPAELVIGYRAVPFLGHAWVELYGSVVNDSPVYKERLNVLMRT